MASALSGYSHVLGSAGIWLDVQLADRATHAGNVSQMMTTIGRNCNAGGKVSTEVEARTVDFAHVSIDIERFRISPKSHQCINGEPMLEHASMLLSMDRYCYGG